MTDSQVSHLSDGKKSSALEQKTKLKFPQKPFLKWVGGKRFLLPELLQHTPEKFNAYFEPFLGGGALFFALAPILEKAYLSDLNQDLVQTFEIVKELPSKLISTLKFYASRHSEKLYYQLRTKPFADTDLGRAARFIYLNKTCFGGLYRENQYGKFNVPFGHYENPQIADHFAIYGCSKLLQKADLACHDFSKINPEPGDFVYLDPPYHGANNLVFSTYNKGGFGIQEHFRLKKFVSELTKNGVHVMLSGLDTDFLRELYKEPEFKIHPIESNHRIANAKATVSERKELLITNY